MIFVQGEGIDGEWYEFSLPAAETIDEAKEFCQELLESLDGGYFEIYEITKSDRTFLGYIDW